MSENLFPVVLVLVIAGFSLLLIRKGKLHIVSHQLFSGRRHTGSVTGKLVLAICIFTILGTSLSLFTVIKDQKKNSLADAIAYTNSFSDLTKKSLRYDMLMVNREGIQKTLEFLGTSESVNDVRILDHSGRIYYSSKPEIIGRRITTASPHCTGCHLTDNAPFQSLAEDNKWTISENQDGVRTITFAEPIYNESDCYTAACHAHEQNQRVLGMLLTDYSLETIDSRIKKQIPLISLFIVLVVAVTAAILSLILWKIVLQPLTSLSRGMEQVSSGNLAPVIAVQSNDEIGRLATTFNTMTSELAVARRKLEEWTANLEKEVDNKTIEIKKANTRLVEAEKMAALGRLTSEIAHEIRNPLTAIGGFGRRLLKNTTNPTQQKYAEIIVSEASRLENILREVLVYSRNVQLNFSKDTLHETVARSVTLYKDLCLEQSINIKIIHRTELPVLMEKDQVEQATGNLLSNAIDAMPNGGTMTVMTREEHANDIQYVALHVIDTGAGVPREKLPFIFEPFFTTKKIGHGTGLGLAISRKIIEEHGGFIKADPANGKGLKISLFFPYQGEEECGKTPCWEFMGCNQESNHETKCQAYPHFGRVCWAVAGTHCSGKINGTYAQKINGCSTCGFYHHVMAERTGEAMQQLNEPL